MANGDTRINLRVPASLRAKIEALAEAESITLSQACRILLGAALRDASAQIVVREVVFDFARTRAEIVNQLMRRTSDIFDELVEDATAAAATAADADAVSAA